jgi:hypothetical protein
VILVESVMEPDGRRDVGTVLDYEMLMLTGGRERSEAEFRALLATAGFTLTRVVKTTSPLSVVEAEAH